MCKVVYAIPGCNTVNSNVKLNTKLINHDKRDGTLAKDATTKKMNKRYIT